MTANTTAAAFTVASADIMKNAYDSLFDLCQLASSGRTYEGIEIDYASFDRLSTMLNEECEIICTVNPGANEGIYIDVTARRYDASIRDYRTAAIGTIKTLREGRAAHKAMGALAGELAYLANCDVWSCYRAFLREQRKRA